MPPQIRVPTVLIHSGLNLFTLLPCFGQTRLKFCAGMDH
jgi:hypothetical protein